MPTDHGFGLAFAMCLVALVAALGFALSVPRRRRAGEVAPAPIVTPSRAGEPERVAA